MQQSQPDVLISNVGMPGQHSYALLRQVRNESDRVGMVPAIAPTAYSTEKDRKQLLEAGFQLHLSKSGSNPLA
ncbi:response regulator [Leptolyngbya sp. FACHB-8]|nr:response regulator [Leptolyngbya sp. FACHB-8]MBD1913225.1 response regulator [Leptolyngbya sp. FACHB-8]